MRMQRQWFSGALVVVSALAGASGCGSPEDGEQEELIDPATDPDLVPLDDGKADGVSSIPSAVTAAAEKNLVRIAKDLDAMHINSYRYTGTVDRQFFYALKKEYIQKAPELYKRKIQALASIIFVKDPAAMPPPGGRVTPFHGLDATAYGRLMRMEDLVFNKHVSLAGSLKGVRPFSVCETKFMIDKYVKDPSSPLVQNPLFALDSTEWPRYQMAYSTYEKSCPQADKLEWYNFRGLGKLRPSWLESNVMDRFLRKYNDDCRSTSNQSPDCVAWRANRLDLRNDKNKDLGRRMFVYHPSQESHLSSTKAPLVLVPDQNGDGVSEIITSSNTYRDTNGMNLPVSITSTGEFTGSLNAPWKDINLTTQVDERYTAADRSRSDFGLLKMFPTASGCEGVNPSPTTCPLMKRFYVMIDRHEDFYATYTSLYNTSMNLGKQPSPLVACSITLRAADHWAHSSPIGVDGFVYLMRIPFADILAGGPTTVSTVEPKPVVTTLLDIYKAGKPLDFERYWLDVASLSNNIYSSEHEISKYGYVRPEQIEGILYTGTPAP